MREKTNKQTNQVESFWLGDRRVTDVAQFLSLICPH